MPKPSSTATATRMSPGVIVLLLSLLLGLQPITTDLYLPALPGAHRRLWLHPWRRRN